MEEFANSVLRLPATIFIVIGAFMFLTEANKFINKALGVKDAEGSFLGKAMGVAGLAAGGLAAGGLGGAIAAGSGNRLAGMKAGMLNGLNNGLNKGKIGDSFKQSLDTGTLIKTGGENAKYQNRIQKAQEDLTKNHIAQNMGYADSDEMNKAIERYKTNRNVAKNNLDAAVAAYQRGESFNYDGKDYSDNELYDLIYGQNGLSVSYSKAESKYNDINSYAGRFGMGSKSKTAEENAMDAKDFFEDGKYKGRYVQGTHSTVTNNIQQDVDVENNIQTNVNQTTTWQNIGGSKVETTPSGIIMGGDIDGAFNELTGNNKNSTGQNNHNNINGTTSNNNTGGVTSNNGNTNSGTGKKILGPDGKPLN